MPILLRRGGRNLATIAFHRVRCIDSVVRQARVGVANIEIACPQFTSVTSRRESLVECRYPAMQNEFTAIFERDEEWFIAYCPEIPGANGQGRTKDEARENLAQAIALVLEDRREEGLRGVPADAERGTIVVP